MRGNRLLWIGAAILLLLAGGAYGVFLYPSHAARVAIDQVIADLPTGWTAKYGAVRYNLLKQQLQVSDLLIAGGDNEIEIGRLTVSGLGGVPAPGQSLQLREASLLEVRARAQGEQASLRSLDSRDLSGDFASAFRNFASREPGDALLAFVDLISIKRLDVRDLRGIGPGASANLGHVTIADMGSGQIGVVSSEDLRGRKDSFSISMPILRAEGIDIAGLRAVFDSASYAPGVGTAREERSLLRKLVVSSFQCGDDTGNVRLTSLQFQELRGRPFILAPTAENLGDPRLLADMGIALSLGSYAMRGARLEASQQGLALAVDRLELGTYRAGRLERGQLQGFRLDIEKPPQPLTLELANLELRGADPSRLLRAIAAQGGTGSASRIDGREAIEVPFARLADFELGLGNKPPLRLAELAIDSDYQDGNATQSRGRLAKLEVPMTIIPFDPGTAAGIRQLIGDRLLLDMALEMHSDPKAHRLALDKYEMNASGLGALTIRGVMDGVDADALTQGSPEAQQAAMQHAALERLEISYNDSSLVGRILRTIATQNGTTTEKLRSGLIQQVQASAPQGTADATQQQQVDALVHFLQRPRKLSLVATPPQPVQLGALVGVPPSEIARRLKLAITAE